MTRRRLATLGALLIPRLGALGAGISIMIAVSAYNVLKQAGLRLGTGVRLFDWHYARIYGLIMVCAATLMLIQTSTAAPVYVSVALAAVMSLVVIGLSARLLDVSGTVYSSTTVTLAPDQGTSFLTFSFSPPFVLRCSAAGNTNTGTKGLRLSASATDGTTGPALSAVQSF